MVLQICSTAQCSAANTFAVIIRGNDHDADVLRNLTLILRAAAVWWGAITGVLTAVLIGVIFVIIFYVLGNSVFQVLLFSTHGVHGNWVLYAGSVQQLMVAARLNFIKFSNLAPVTRQAPRVAVLAN